MMTTEHDDWETEAREVPEELSDDFEHGTFPPPATRWNTVADQLTDADRETLRLWVAGGTGDVNYRQTEIGGE